MIQKGSNCLKRLCFQLLIQKTGNPLKGNQFYTKRKRV
jgi:hypothetical protein